ncbi:Ribokinase-like protein [Chytridium lagenaria]|nr:Ribokinase-like protein [Chytridium lagenaria]
MQRRALTIAGSDSGGGAGIQADLKTFMSFRVHGSSSITAITAQNTVGVQDIEPLRPDIVTHQIVSVLSDIGADSIKIGMLFSSDIINAVADTLEEFRSIPLIIDPVMVATAQSRLSEVLTGVRIQCAEDMRESARILSMAGSKYVLVKANVNDQNQVIVDLFYDGENFVEIRNPYIHSKNTHGTGCTLSAAIASCIAHGYTPNKIKAIQSVREGIDYVRAAMKNGFSIGSGHGPVNHFFHVPCLQLQSPAQFHLEEISAHSFVEAIALGTLDVNLFRQFLKQDFLFLKQFARSSALATYKTKDLDLLDTSASRTSNLLLESRLHIDSAAESLETSAYIRFVLEVGISGSLLELDVAMLPCILGYGLIGKRW